MRILLLFPPNYKYPAATPPLGIAYLKSYVLSSFDESVDVDCVDVNIQAINKLISTTDVSEYISKLSTGILDKQDKESLRSVSEIPITTIANISNNINTHESFGDNVVYVNSVKIVSDYISAFSRIIFKSAEHINKGCVEVQNDYDLELFCKILGITEINFQEYDLVGLSALYTDQITLSILISSLIKYKSINTAVMLGGAAITQMPEENYKSILFEGSAVDYICDGEGELTMLEYTRQCVTGKYHLHEVPNIRYFDNKKIIKTRRTLIQKLDAIPFPCLKDFDLTQYHSPAAIIPMITTRGCSWSKCKFCDYNRNYNSRYRVRSIDNIVDEIKEHCLQYSNNGCLYVSFDDSEISAVRAERLAKKIIDNDINMRYLFLSRPTSLHTKERLKTIQLSGCIVICYGVESFNQKILDLERKGTNVPDIKLALNNAKSVGILTYCLYFVGFPGQTFCDLQVEFEEILKSYESIDLLAKTNFILLRNTAADMRNYLDEDYDRYQPLFYYENNPIYSRVIPFNMKQGLNAEDAAVAMELIHDFYLSLKGLRDGKLRPEYHEIISRKDSKNTKQRQQIFDFVSKYKTNLSKNEQIYSKIRKSEVVDLVFNHDGFLKSYISAITIDNEKLTNACTRTQ